MNEYLAATALRRDVYQRLEQWNNRDAVETYAREVIHLAALLGYKHIGAMRHRFTTKDEETCKALLTADGYALYRMMLIRLGRTK